MRIRGTGPMPSAHLLISDFPGKEEDRVGYPLVGRLGKEVRRMFNMDPDIPNFDEWRSENLIREYRPDSKDYSEADVERDGPELRRAIEATNPSTIVTMGRFSARFLLGDVDLDGAHSMPWAVDGHTVISLYNPAAGWKSPDIQARVSYGFGQLAGYFKGEITPKVYGADAFAGRERYVEILSPSDIRLDPDLPIYIDSEGWAARPWSVQYSQRPGEGYLIDASRLDCIATFRTQLRGIPEKGIRGPRIVYHSALHDLSVLRAMGIETADLPFGDTQVQSYLLQVEPLGLKPLAARHAGMAMSSYDDLTGGIGDELARDYAVSLYDIEQAEYEIRQAAALDTINATPLVDKAGNARRGKDGNIRYRRVTKPPTVSKSRLHAASQRVLRSPNPRKLWGNQDDDIHVAAYNRLGPLDQPTLDHVDRNSAVRYASRDSDATGRVAAELGPRIKAMALAGVYELELGTYPLIDRMGAVGLRPDLGHFVTLSGKLQGEIDSLQSELDSLTNREAFNANSGDQVRTLLFDELGLPGSKRTASGDWSTNDKILEGLEREYGTRVPVVSTIRQFRETYKLKNTFVDRIPDFVARWPKDGRIHSTFRTTRVVTGRLAASDPNILAMPKHGKFAPEFRAGFVADPGHVLASWDQSQIELRVLAHLSQDPVLLAAYRDGIDLHAKLAQRIFGGVEADYKKGTGRLAAKAVNFGLPMGMTRYGLAIELRKNGLSVDEDDAQRWIDETDALYTGVPVYKARMIAEARRNGFIRCLSGRIRYIGGIRSGDEFLREEAARFAFSTPVQEGAQWIMKQAEIRVWNDVILPFQRQGRWIEPIVQVHDDLVLEADDDPAFLLELNTAMRWAMTEAPERISVPLDTSGDAGPNWRDMEPIVQEG